MHDTMPQLDDSDETSPKAAPKNGKPLPLGAKVAGKIPNLYKSGKSATPPLNDPVQDPLAEPGSQPPEASENTMTGGAPERQFTADGPPTSVPPNPGNTKSLFAAPQAAPPPGGLTPMRKAPPPPTQTEASNPLTGTTANTPGGGTTQPIIPGGTGDMQRSFSNPTSSDIYGSYVKNLFSPKGSPSPKARTGLRRAPAKAVA